MFRKYSYFILGFSSALTIIAFAAFSFKFFAALKPAKIEVITKTDNTSQITNASPTYVLSATDAKPLEERVADALDSKNFAYVLDAFTDNLVIGQNSVCCTTRPKKAIDDFTLEFLQSSETPWRFVEDNNLIKNLKASYPEIFNETLSWISGNAQQVVFGLDANGSVKAVFISEDASSL